jgi:ribonuclease HI
LQGELLGCHVGLEEIVKLGITHITLEVDATPVMEAIETKAYRLAFVGVITDIK